MVFSNTYPVGYELNAEKQLCFAYCCEVETPDEQTDPSSSHACRKETEMKASLSIKRNIIIIRVIIVNGLFLKLYIRKQYNEVRSIHGPKS